MKKRKQTPVTLRDWPIDRVCQLCCCPIHWWQPDARFPKGHDFEDPKYRAHRRCMK
jgi:hypothetical protein